MMNRRSEQAEAAFRARLAEFGATLLEPVWLGATLLESVWLGSHQPHRAVCDAGHECRPMPSHTRQGVGICRTCAGRDPAATEAAFRARLAELGATLLEPYRGSSSPHRVRCASGHIGSPTPSHVQQGNGICRECAQGAQDAFYVVAADSLHRLKFGITSGDPGPRLTRHRRVGYRTVVRLMTGLPETVAAEMEQAVLSTLRLAGLEPVHGREWFDIAALALVLDIADNYHDQAYEEAA